MQKSRTLSMLAAVLAMAGLPAPVAVDVPAMGSSSSIGKGRPGAQMAGIRAARKARNIRRFRKAARR